jgi:hypothetical protein
VKRLLASRERTGLVCAVKLRGVGSKRSQLAAMSEEHEDNIIKYFKKNADALDVDEEWYLLGCYAVWLL